jgi:hypothetical protein
MTTMTARPAAWGPLEHALRQRRPIQVTYHGRSRVVCPHALGWHHTRPMLLGYQVGGQTSTGSLDPDPRKRWRCMFIDEIDHVTVVESATPWASAENYNPARPFPSIDQLAIAIPARENQPHG